MPREPPAWEMWEDLNRLDTLEKVSLFSIAMGLFTGILILTGFDVTPEGTIQYAVSAIIASFTSSLGPYSIIIGAAVAIAFAVYGVVGAIRSIRTIMTYGVPGVVIAVTGFAAGMIVILFSGSLIAGYVFVVLLLISLGGSLLVTSIRSNASRY